MSFFSKPKPSPELFKGQFITIAKVKELFPNSYVLLENPTIATASNTTLGGILLYAHPKREKLINLYIQMPKPWPNLLTIIDTNIYDQETDFCL